MEYPALEEQPSMMPGLVLKLPQLEVIEQLLHAALDGSGQRWYTLEQAHYRKHGALPGGVSLKTIRNTLALQPRGGIPDGWISGRKAWRAETIEEWCQIDDSNLEAYLKMYAPHLRVPKRIQEANARHAIEYTAFPDKETGYEEEDPAARS
jgi:DNA-binding transcriptional MerR regulator